MSIDPTGRFLWRELVTSTPAFGFYRDLFGWSVREVPMGDGPTYAMFRHETLEEDVGGAIAPPMAGVPSHWLDYVGIADVDAALPRVAMLGGKAITPVVPIPGIGRFAVIEDAVGAVLALFTPEPGEGRADRSAPAHTFCWSQLMTAEPARAVPFYAGLFGWTPAPMGEGTTVFRAGADGGADADAKMVATLQAVPAGAMPSNWLKYVAVVDTDASHARALDLGAKSLMGPANVPGMGRYAVLADPSGAVFALWQAAA
jgi:predicted enzyme related to lactoylglutathione lyase